uniref:Ubiquitin-like domain-containing protein n=1 Tax=Minutocellus polymorphus TaxID=265543 RepID=A0A7S0ARD7_9STRA|mmetsp:Transcript_2298/g.3858  ORF Transcript_2298/g.3858 Transcript_2298/m.3858 type:complete len:172 (+) Transcript_2298:65-580(+)
MTAVPSPAPLRNLFVRCPDGQTLCLTDVDVATESSTDLRHRIVQKWQPTTCASIGDAGISFLLLRFLAFVGLVRKLENELYLTHGGKPLVVVDRAVGNDASSSSSLAKYNIRNEATIHATVRVRGGCFMVSLSILCIIVGAMMMSVFTCGGSLIVVPFLAPFLFILPFFCL